MTMAQHDGAEVVERRSQFPGVFNQQIGLARVEEQTVRPKLNVPGQSVLGFQTAHVDRVFNQDRDANVVTHWD
jgi:hypothetical protein